MPLRVALVVCLGAAVFATHAAAQGYTNQAAQDLKRLTIEELTEIDVTSVSRRSERLAETPRR